MSEHKSAAGAVSPSRDSTPVGAFAPVASSRGRDWHGIDAMRFRHTSGGASGPPFSRHLLVVHLGRTVHVSVKAGGLAGEATVTPGSVTIVPAGAPNEARWTEGVVYDTLHLYVDPALVREAAEAGGVDPDRVQIVPAVGVRDAEIERAALSLLGELEAEGLSGRLYAEASAVRLAVHLLRHHASLPPDIAHKAARRPEGSLPGPALRLVAEYVEANLDRRGLSLAELAGLVGLSPNHFATLFRRSTGLAPHRYLINRRVEHARLLLSATGAPLAEVANRSGFADQAHMTRHFGRLLGITPGSLRRGSHPGVS